jgi:hypothetical protein
VTACRPCDQVTHRQVDGSLNPPAACRKSDHAERRNHRPPSASGILRGSSSVLLTRRKRVAALTIMPRRLNRPAAGSLLTSPPKCLMLVVSRFVRCAWGITTGGASFSKRSLLTRRVLAAKATHAQHPSHRFTADGQILGTTRIVTMNGLRWALTTRTRRRGLLGRSVYYHDCLTIHHLRDSKTRELKREGKQRKPPTSITSSSHFYLRNRVAIPLHERCG